MITDLENAIPVDDRGNVILTMLDAVIDAHLGQTTTHYTNCWKDHAGCLAVVLKPLLIEGAAPTPATPTRRRINVPDRVRYGSLPNWA